MEVDTFDITMRYEKFLFSWPCRLSA